MTAWSGRAELVETSISSISEHFPDLIRGETVQIMVGDGHKGLPQHAPYDWYWPAFRFSTVPTEFDVRARLVFTWAQQSRTFPRTYWVS